MEIPLKTSIRFVGILWENDIEVLEMNTDKSKEYEDKWKKIYYQLKNLWSDLKWRCLLNYNKTRFSNGKWREYHE